MKLLEYKRLMNVEIHQIDFNGHISTRLLCDLFSDVAQRHTEILKIDVASLKEQGLTWMLHRIHIIINKMPQLNNKIEILTHPAGLNRLFAERCYRISKSNGEELIKAKSEWMLIDIERRRPARPTETLIEINKDLVVPSDMPLNEIEKNQMPTEFESSRKFTATFDNIDFNGHVTQASYLQWFNNSLSFNFHKKHLLSEAEIIYEHEILPEQEVISWINISTNKDKTIIWHKLTSLDGKLEHCFGKTIWNNLTI